MHQRAGERLEDLLVLGDRGFIQISEEQKIQIVVASQVERHLYISHEHIHFNAKLHVGQVHTQRADSGGLLFKDEVLYPPGNQI